ncbi:class I SAM-dependent methyltransferase [Luteimonas salinilitoris]|uniref:Class I SAM-dependent methyltransferase n=1 Tax=Luteimonas salinilitoris TaxID=3237697 RepID=A0ABV4HST2_9GAMM
MSTASDARFWDRFSRSYAKSRIGDPAGYARTLQCTRGHLGQDDRVLELGCGTGTTALRLASGVRSYLATDISSGMIAIAEEKLVAGPIAGLAFRIATAEALAQEVGQYEAVLGFNYLHLLRDVSGTLRVIHALLAPGGLFISKTPCLGSMNPLIRLVLLPVMRAVGKAPQVVSTFSTVELEQLITVAGFDIFITENHATRGKDDRPYIVACKQ